MIFLILRWFIVPTQGIELMTPVGLASKRPSMRKAFY